MKSWSTRFRQELTHSVRILFSPACREHPGDRTDRAGWLWLLGALPLVSLIGVLGFYRPSFLVTERIPDLETAPRFADLHKPVRKEPRRFLANTHLPVYGEGKASGSLGNYPFLPKHDLTRLEDDRVWWESEHDTNDTEDDHIIHRSMEEPLRRLIELVDQEKALLKIQDIYREEGIHAVKSLHKEGRAIDLTAEGIGLEKLAKLAWAAGFDWVYNEAPQRGGAHVHASVRPVRDELVDTRP